MTGSNWTSCDLRSVEVGVVGAAQCGARLAETDLVSTVRGGHHLVLESPEQNNSN